MYETLKRTLFTSGDVKKKKKRLRDGEKCQLGFKNLYLLSRESQIHPDGQIIRKRLSVLLRLNAKKLKFLVLASVSRCGRRQVVFSSEYVDGKGGCGKEAGRVERKSLSLVRSLLR